MPPGVRILTRLELVMGCEHCSFLLAIGSHSGVLRTTYCTFKNLKRLLSQSCRNSLACYENLAYQLTVKCYLDYRKNETPPRPSNQFTCNSLTVIMMPRRTVVPL